MRLKLAGEAPAILGGLQVVLVFLLSIDSFHLDANEVALIMAAAAAVCALVVAWATKHVVLAVVIGAFEAIVALFAGYGVTLSESTTAAIIGMVVFVFSIVNRQATSPQYMNGSDASGQVIQFPAKKAA